MVKRPRSKTVQVIRITFWSAVFLFFVVSWFVTIRMPGKSFRGKAPPLTATEQELSHELRHEVEKLGGEIGERNLWHYLALQATALYIEGELTKAGWKVRRDEYEVQGKNCRNIEAELPGKSSEIVLIGAHYDSVLGAPGANDNGSGVAALLALARRMAGSHNFRTLRLVAFVNEEPFFFQSKEMGSYIYAERCRQRGDKIVAMISLETIGYFSNAAGSQRYPVPAFGLIYPRTGNFIGFVSNMGSRSLLRIALGEFRRVATIPSEGAALPASVPGVGWSDQWSFWEHGYPGIMITDTAPFRYPDYHKATDTPDKLNYEEMTRVGTGLESVIRKLANP